jgi:hypothetical protein
VHATKRQLLKKYNIPYTVLINHPESGLSDTSTSTLVPWEEDEIFYNGAGYNPFMAQKFLVAVKMYFRSFSSFEDIPNFIVRTNATTYIHYPSLLAHLETLPRTRVIAGPEYGDDEFVQGMVMIFSKDVLQNMLMDSAMYNKDIMSFNDDVSLSILSKPHADRHYISEHVVMPNEHTVNEKGLYHLPRIQPRENKKWIFRIAHYENRDIDLENWNLLMSYYDDIQHHHSIVPLTTTSSSPSSLHSSSKKRWILFIMLGLFILILMIVLVRWIH